MSSEKKELDEKPFEELVGEGRTNREIAQIMRVSLGTVGRKRAAPYPRPVQKEEANHQQEKGANGGEPPPADPEQMMKQDQALVTVVPTNRPLVETVIKT